MSSVIEAPFKYSFWMHFGNCFNVCLVDKVMGCPAFTQNQNAPNVDLGVWTRTSAISFMYLSPSACVPSFTPRTPFPAFPSRQPVNFSTAFRMTTNSGSHNHPFLCKSLLPCLPLTSLTLCCSLRNVSVEIEISNTAIYHQTYHF